ncbi:MFS transporter [Kineococcus rhizosphaerae]|uniref:CP family cyanate transporter-like MFS transporter n=1 Tax=Kineococcus rhizosphaerae TaxID=559628 RepID=A0A2T0QX45_9ACTN|nr:MFS transporter [Kineococcus rhizosphaerae]PRY10071.1 CP family cyanate transporter-like MFS transporter [Kineococcus rhizosphaerae]
MQTSAPAPQRARRTAVVLLAGLLLVSCAMRAPLTGVGSVLDEISGDLGLSAAAAGALTSLPLLAFAGSSLVVPALARRLGQRPTLVLALFLLALGAGLRWVPGVVPLFAGTAVVGVAIAVANVLMPALIRTEFPGRIPLLTSTYVVLMQVVGSLASGLAVPLSESLAGGWRTAIVVWAAPALLAAVLWLPLVRDHRAATAHGRARTPWRSPLAWAVTAFMGSQSILFYVLLSWLATIARDRSGLDPTEAGVLLSVLQVAGVVGSLLAPAVAGRSVTRTRWAAVGSTVLSAAGLATLLLAPGAAHAAVVLLGLGGGGSVVLALAAVSSRAADGAGAVALSGMAQAVGYGAAAVGPVLFGALHSVTGSWTLPLAVLTAVAVVQLVPAWAANRDATVRA